jgi:bacterioferritin (cytochrome b1)
VAEKEGMDVGAVLDQLGEAVSLQYRSALEYTLVAGSITGFEYTALSEELWGFAEEELASARLLIEKMVALGGEPPAEPRPFDWSKDPSAGFSALIEHEEEGIDTLQDVIPNTGKDGRSEAIEHLMEHLILRKQSQVDFLVRASGRAG